MKTKMKKRGFSRKELMIYCNKEWRIPVVDEQQEGDGGVKGGRP
jgi:hypothetical protein